MALQQEAIKWIAGTDFMVDGFKFQNLRCRRYFLTHFHSDHTIGLYRSFNSGTIFCSRITAALLINCMGLRSDCIQVLPMDKTVTIDGVEVTALDANHCPGSVMLLFKVPGHGGRPAQVILHTGDFRYHERMADYPSLRNTLIDTIYLDTTYAYPRHTFPSQEDAIATTVRLCRKHLLDEARPLFVFGAYQIGKERAVIGAAKALGLRVHIEPRKRRILSLLDLQDMDLFTPNAADADIHLGFMSEVRPPAMLRRLKEGGGKWAQVIGFRPTGWSFRKDGVHTTKQGLATVYGVPYSEHSSFDDLRACIAALRPRKIIPTVNADTKLKAANLVARFADLMDLSANRYRIDAFFRPRPAKRLDSGLPTTDTQSPDVCASKRPDESADAFRTRGLNGMCPSAKMQDQVTFAGEAEPQFGESELLSEGVMEASVMREDEAGCGSERDEGFAERNEGFEELTEACEERKERFAERNEGSEDLNKGYQELIEGFANRNESSEQRKGGFAELKEGSEERKEGFAEQNQGFEELIGVQGLDCEGPDEEAAFSEFDEEVSERGEEECIDGGSDTLLWEGATDGLVKGGESGMQFESHGQETRFKETQESAFQEGLDTSSFQPVDVARAADGRCKQEVASGLGDECLEKACEGRTENWAEAATGGESDAAKNGGASDGILEKISRPFLESECGGDSGGQKQGLGPEEGRGFEWSESRMGGRTREANLHEGGQVAECWGQGADGDLGVGNESSQGYFEGSDTDETAAEVSDTWQIGHQDGDDGGSWEEIPVDRLLRSGGTAREAELCTDEARGKVTDSPLGDGTVSQSAWDCDCAPEGVEQEARKRSVAGALLPSDERGKISTEVGRLGNRTAELEKESNHGNVDFATCNGRKDDGEVRPCAQASEEEGHETFEGPHPTSGLSTECTVHSCEISVDIMAIDSREQAYILRSIEQAKMKTDQKPRGKRKVTIPGGSRVANTGQSGPRGKKPKSSSPGVPASEFAGRAKSEGQTQGQTLIKSFFCLRRTA
ncbi:putative DNA repair metallo-beta-lactamase family protein [Klebsormidium nitens]|uniref:Putative DNA repair metallo-beta-lactamase family protein n=1 Tax=Klebsormidium nitens TaxID=105231 RepID=A0A1Y1HYN4_KLENI|nr:putative DNA repair metallo-beta-lactamase family protein [Klebsormidium nitens]|eukprot:GAQ83770.1 putative DNA repair metallo-beta-lactamase family protein [Klebsormidium nitens]